MDVKKALYISQEISPYLPASPMSTKCRNLSQGVQESGVEVRTFMPRFGAINERRNQLHEVIRLSGLNLVIDDTDHPLIIKVATLQPSRMQVYFIDSDDYFRRHLSAGLEIEVDPAENDERLMFFARGVIETVKKLRWTPDMIHCSGWISALIPLYLRKAYANEPAFRDCKIVYSIFDNKMPEILNVRAAEKLKMDNFSDSDLKALDTPDAIDTASLHRIAIDYADAIIQASENIDPEILEYAKASGKPFMACGADEYNLTESHIEFYKQL